MKYSTYLNVQHLLSYNECSNPLRYQAKVAAYRYARQSNETARGFTLVELLVVVAMIAILAVAVFMLAPRMMDRAKNAKSVANLRQIGNVMMTYAADNQNRMPAPRRIPQSGDPSDAPVHLHWNELLLFELYPNITYKQILDKNWWFSTEPILKNPLIPQTIFETYYTGYGMSSRLWAYANQGSEAHPFNDQVLTKPINISKIPNPAATPMVAPSPDWHFDLGLLKGKEGFRVAHFRSIFPNEDPKAPLPFLFLDGHVELMTVREYESRQLHLQPR